MFLLKGKIRVHRGTHTDKELQDQKQDAGKIAVQVDRFTEI